MRTFLGSLALVVLGCGSAVGQTRFSVRQDGPLWWLVDPTGAQFVSLGACCVGTGTGFGDYDFANPSYAGYRYYKDRGDWARDVDTRLAAWHFNTIGAWSEDGSLDLDPKSPLYHTPILDLGAKAGAPWRDMWSPSVVADMGQAAHDRISALKDKSKVIGYFSDNEMGWWEGALFDWIWKSPAGSGPRTHFSDVLKARYGSWPSVVKDFDPEGCSSFENMKTAGRLFLRPGGAGMKAVQSYVSILADRYYSLCKGMIAKEDPKGLYLGDRYISNFYPEVAEASTKSVDVVSTNLNADWNDGGFAQFYLSSLQTATAKPILISEYYQAATENRSGNKNDSSNFPVSPTQEERASSADVSTHYLLSQPYVVGAHWFQYADEPKNGRGDGENYNFGLVDVDNKPYDLLTSRFTALDSAKVHRDGIVKAMDVSHGVPRISDHPADLQTWNRVRGYFAPTADSGRADLYLAWGPDGLYLGMYWNEDRFAEAYYRGGKIPDQDFAKVNVRVGSAYVSVAVPPTGPAVVSGPGEVLNVKYGVRCQALIKIRAASMGLEMKDGGHAVISAGLATRGRAYFGRWQGDLTLIGD